MKRWTPRVVALTAALAAGCAPDYAAPQRPSAATDVLLPPEVRTISARISRGATLASVLRAHEIAEQDVAALIARAASVFDLRKVRVDQPYLITRAITGALRHFEYEIDGDRILKITRSVEEPAAEFVAEVVPIEKVIRPAVVHAAIDDDASSLYAALDRSGETVQLAIDLAGIFGSEIDFNTEVQPNDRFRVLVQKEYRLDDQFAGYGAIDAAEIVNDGRTIRAIRFAAAGSEPAYYDEQGRSLRRFFLRSPLKFDPVITSGFSRRRLHPVLHTYRSHNGVDYRAPHGAPVIAVADGVVLFAAMNGGSGRMVTLRHANGFESQYLHLSSIAVRRGGRVQQGEVIGRVGATGLATGPHLHYQLKKNGALVNPVTAHRAMPPGDPVPAAQMDKFREVRDRALAMLEPSKPEVVAAANH